VVDTSVLVKWFVPEDDEVPHALALREAHLAGTVSVRICELAAFEAAAARHHQVPLVSADRQLLAAGLAESPTDAARRPHLLS